MIRMHSKGDTSRVRVNTEVYRQVLLYEFNNRSVSN